MPKRQSIPQEIPQIISSMLKSNEIERVMDRFDPSHSLRAHTREIAKHLDIIPTLPMAMEEQIQLLSFMRHFVEHQRNSLAKTSLRESFNTAVYHLTNIVKTPENKPRLNEERNKRRADFDRLAGALRDVLPDDQLVDIDDLIPRFKEPLRAMTRHSVQRFRIWTDFKEKASHTAHHLKETIMEHPRTNASIAVVFFPLALYLMVEGNYAQQINNTVEVRETGATNLSADNIFNSGTHNYDPGIRAEFFDRNFKSCHDELKGTFPLLVTALEDQGYRIPWPHCTLVNNISYNVQQGLLNTSEALAILLYAVIEGTTGRAVNEMENIDVFAHSYGLQAAQEFLEWFPSTLNGLNRLENMAHIPLGLSSIQYGFILALSLAFANGRREKHLHHHGHHHSHHHDHDHSHGGWKALWNHMSRLRPLNYAFSAAALGAYLRFHGYDNSLSMVDSNLIPVLAGGAFAGYLTHKVIAMSEPNKEYAMKVSGDAAMLLQNFNSGSLPLSEQLKLERPEKIRKLKNGAALLGTASLAYGALIAADAGGFIRAMDEGILKSGLIEAAELAIVAPLATGTTIFALVYNFVIEDPAQHTVFIGGGGGFGALLGGIVVAAVLAVKYGPAMAQKYRKELVAGLAAAGLTVTPAEAKILDNFDNHVEQTVALLRQEDLEEELYPEIIPT